jgi:hypothetical protein
VAERLKAEGVSVAVEKDYLWDDGTVPRWQIRFRQRHRKQVEAAVDEVT